MEELRDILKATAKASDLIDTSKTDLVHKNEVKKELTEISKKEQLCRRLLKYRDPEECIRDYTIEAVRVMIVECICGKHSADRRAAAKELMDRGLGKPVERVMSVAMKAQQMPEEELENETQKLLNQLGYKDPRPRFKASDKDASIYMDSPKSDDLDFLK